MMKGIRIVSGGTATTTRVYTQDGSELTGIVNIKIDEISCGSVTKATITFNQVELDLLIEACDTGT